MKELRVGVALCGSFCTFSQMIPEIKRLTELYETVIPILSETSASTDTRFGMAEDFIREIEALCGRKVIRSIPEAEPIGPQKLLDILVVAPCTGNTLAKLALGITDTAVTMAAKAHLRNGRPLVIGISTNDALAGNARNLGELLCRRHVYFIPFRQDDPKGKPTSLVANLHLIPETIEEALKGEQLQPILAAGA